VEAVSEVASLTLGVCSETVPGEDRVAVVPDVVGRIRALGLDVVVEAGAGAAAGFPDAAYARSGAGVLSRREVLGLADVLLGVLPPGGAAGDLLRRGQTVAGLLRPRRHPLTVRWWAGLGLTAIAVDLLDEDAGGAAASGRPGPPAPPVDAAAAQARISGHLAALTGFTRAGRTLPASVTGSPRRQARVLVVGTGPAGRQAVATARHLGATTRAHSLRGNGGSASHRSILSREVPDCDIVVITPEELSPSDPDVLITAAAASAMPPGSVIVDTTVEPDGGSAELAVPDTTVVVPPRVAVVGAGHLPSRVAHAASTAYAERVVALLARFVRGGRVVIDLADPLHRALVVTHRGGILDETVQEYLFRLTEAAGLP
jgi:NAD(P) transhydrogenase subunit alpha